MRSLRAPFLFDEDTEAQNINEGIENLVAALSLLCITMKFKVVRTLRKKIRESARCLEQGSGRGIPWGTGQFVLAGGSGSESSPSLGMST